MKSPVAFRIAAVVPGIVGDRVDADDRVARAVRPAPRAATPGCPRSNPTGGWAAAGSTAGRAGRRCWSRARRRGSCAPRRSRSRLVISFAHAGDHLAGQPARQAQQRRAVGRVGQHVLAQLRHRPRLHAVVDRPLQVVEDQARDRVLLGRHDRVLVAARPASPRPARAWPRPAPSTLSAARPASRSPDFSSLALASTCFRSRNR